MNEQIERCLKDMCEHYCKYPDIWDEEKQGTPLSDSEHCKNCPLDRIEELIK